MKFIKKPQYSTVQKYFTENHTEYGQMAGAYAKLRGIRIKKVKEKTHIVNSYPVWLLDKIKFFLER